MARFVLCFHLETNPFRRPVFKLRVEVARFAVDAVVLVAAFEFAAVRTRIVLPLILDPAL